MNRQALISGNGGESACQDLLFVAVPEMLDRARAPRAASDSPGEAGRAPLAVHGSTAIGAGFWCSAANSYPPQRRNRSPTHHRRWIPIAACATGRIPFHSCSELAFPVEKQPLEDPSQDELLLPAELRQRVRDELVRILPGIPLRSFSIRTSPARCTPPRCRRSSGR